MAKESKKKKEAQTAPKPTTILLVRHGQNDWVGKHKLAGWTPGVYLNKHGRKQAKSVGKRFVETNTKIDAIYASPLERTMETAELIAKPLNLPITQCPGIGEVEYGDWTGAEIAKLAKLPEWSVVQYYPSNTQFPQGESLYGMQARGVQQVNKLVAQHPGQTILLVSHADVIKSIIAHYLGVHLDLFQRIVVSPASITTIVFTFMRPMVYTVNDVSHLPPDPKPADKKKTKKKK